MSATSMVEWYYAKDDTQYGPVSAQQLKELADGGRVTPTDLVWHAGVASWSPASQVRGLFLAQPPTSQADATDVVADVLGLPPDRRPTATPPEIVKRPTNFPIEGEPLLSRGIRAVLSDSAIPIGVAMTAFACAVNAFVLIFFSLAISVSTAVPIPNWPPPGSEGMIFVFFGVVIVMAYLIAILQATACYAIFTGQRWAHRLTVWAHGLAASFYLFFVLPPGRRLVYVATPHRLSCSDRLLQPASD